jgi:23S rRNA pseudouridine955/2504/2580 synthase
MSVAQREVGADEAEIRLDRWFRRHFPGVTQGMIEKLCRTGQIRVDGHRAGAATRLAVGQVVRIPPLPAAAPAKAVPAPDPHLRAELARLILYQDAAVIVLDKPPGLAVQGGPGIFRHLDGMLEAFREDGGERPRLVHRLDQETSGVILLARTPGVAAFLARAFRERAMEKTYWAVVIGRPEPRLGRIDLPLRRLAGAKGARSEAAPGDAEAARAITEYRVRDHAGKHVSWLELSPLTGRTHQLRVHCAAIGAPILGDAKYARAEEASAAPQPVTLAEPGARLHLHARRLSLPHPEGGTLTVEAPLPRHMRESFRRFGFAEPKPAAPRHEGGRA